MASEQYTVKIYMLLLVTDQESKYLLTNWQKVYINHIYLALCQSTTHTHTHTHTHTERVDI